MPRHPRTRPLTSGAAVLLALAALTACGSDEESSTATSTTSGSIGTVDLSGDCPKTIVVQDSWFPQVEVGYLFQLFGDDYRIDTEAKSVTAPLAASTGYTGVDIEYRAGGPAIGFQSPQSQMYSDDSITMASVGLDSSLQTSAQFELKGVFAALTRSPLMIMWDPDTYPDVENLGDLGAALEEKGGVVRYSDGTAYMAYLLDQGVFSKDVVDGSYDGTPANFVAAGGKDAQQGYADNEPFVYEHTVSAWGKPVDFELLADNGWDIEPAALTIRADQQDELDGCLKKLVPLLQQAQVDFFDDPSRVEGMLGEVVDGFQTGQVYDQATMENAVKVLEDLDLAGNGADSTVGNIDEARAQKFHDLAEPVFTKLGNAEPKGLKMADLYTNEYIDPEIGF